MPDERDAHSVPPHACYANVLVVGHNAFEFLLDFGQSYHADDPATAGVRIVTAPVYAREMLQTLQDAIDGYEATHGPIPRAPGQ